MGRPFRDLTGQIFNGIKVLRMAECERGSGKHIKWICECPRCHNEFKTGSNHLIAGECGLCKKCTEELATPPHILKYHIGDKFGCWTIIGATNFRNSWKVECECGKQFSPDIIEINNAPEKCDCCIKSKGEKFIYHWLAARNIKYEMQKTFADCKPDKRVLMFDFYLPDYNVIIEYDGEQHFRAVEYWGGEKQLLKNKIYDEYKNDYCAKHNITIIRISYKEDIEQRLNEEIVRLQEKELED